MSAPDVLVHLTKPWNDFYSHSKLAETIVTFFHVGGLLLGGGAAVASDRATFRALRGEAAHRSHHLRELKAVVEGASQDRPGEATTQPAATDF